MSVYMWVEYFSDDSGRHCYALHEDVIQARADQILAEWDAEASGPPDRGIAVSTAEMEARLVARLEQGFPADWYNYGAYQISNLPLPLHPKYVEMVDEWHWQDAMPPLGGAQ